MSPIYGQVDVNPPPVTIRKWVPPALRGSQLSSDGSPTLTHVYTTDTKVFSEADWVYLQLVHIAYQIHPATVAELAALGPVGGPNAQRWTIEGPLVDMPGDPGAGNCSILFEVAHSLTSDPGSDWHEYEDGKYRLRSVKARLTVTRPDDTYDFRVARFALLATRAAPPQRPRRVNGVEDVVPSGTCRVVSTDFEVVGAGTLSVEDDAYLEIL